MSDHLEANLTPPPENGDVALPNGYHLYWRMTEQGREYISDEVGGGVQVWHTALVDDTTLIAAINQENIFRRLESEIEERKRMAAYDRLREMAPNLDSLNTTCASSSAAQSGDL